MGEYGADVTKLAEITSGLLTVKNDCYPEKKGGKLFTYISMTLYYFNL